MPRVTRRTFLGTTAGAAMTAGSARRRERVGWPRGSRATAFGSRSWASTAAAISWRELRPPARRRGRRDLRRRLARARQRPSTAVAGLQAARAARREGLPPHPRRQGGRRAGHRHAQPLARAGRDPGRAGRQARLRREAVQPQPARGRAAGRGRPQAQPRRADGQPAASVAEDRSRRSASCRRAASAGPTSPQRGTRTTARRSARGAGGAAARGARLRALAGPGAAPPFQDNYLHYNWHWFWHWGNGELGQQRRPHPRPLPLGPRRRLPVRVTVGRRPLSLRRRLGVSRTRR